MFGSVETWHLVVATLLLLWSIFILIADSMKPTLKCCIIEIKNPVIGALGGLLYLLAIAYLFSKFPTIITVLFILWGVHNAVQVYRYGTYVATQKMEKFYCYYFLRHLPKVRYIAREEGKIVPAEGIASSKLYKYTLEKFIRALPSDLSEEDKEAILEKLGDISVWAFNELFYKKFSFSPSVYRAVKRKLQSLLSEYGIAKEHIALALSVAINSVLYYWREENKTDEHRRLDEEKKQKEAEWLEEEGRKIRELLNSQKATS